MTPSSRRSGRNALAGAVVVLAHLAVAGLVFVRPPSAPPPSPPAPIAVRLVPSPSAPATPAPDPAEAPASSPAPPAPPAPAPRIAPPAPAPAARPRAVVLSPPPEVEPLAVAAEPPALDLPLLGGAEMAGAVAAGAGRGGGTGMGSGSGAGSGQGAGGACDMVRRLEDALRDDPRVARAAAEAHAALNASGRAMLIWNGDWLQSRGEAGKGLAGVRQAVALEVAFAPAECRDQPMRGLALVALDDRPGGVRLALGRGQWRWSDLLGLSR